MLNEVERQRLVENIANHMIGAQDFIQERAIKNFAQADPEYGANIRRALDKIKMSQVSSKTQQIHALAASSNGAKL